MWSQTALLCVLSLTLRCEQHMPGLATQWRGTRHLCSVVTWMVHFEPSRRTCAASSEILGSGSVGALAPASNSASVDVGPPGVANKNAP